MGEIINFSTFGSCSSRNIFNSEINKDYKKYFQINKSVEASTLISLMSDPIPFDANLINSPEKYDNICVLDDLTKNYLEFAKKDLVDYIILDTFFDVTSNIILYDENKFISSHGRLKRTDLYFFMRNKRSINIFNNFHEYYELWKKSCDKFFNFIYEYCTKTKIILNCSRLVYTLIDNNGNISKNTEFERLAHKINPFLNLLDQYILENFDVNTLRFNPDTYLDSNHRFGPHPIHFVEKFYLDKNQQLLEIINNNLSGFDNQNAKEFRKVKKEEQLNEFTFEKLSFDHLEKIEKARTKLNDDIETRINNYNTARIDVKNYNMTNNHQNNVEIYNYSDFNLLYHYPDWFKDQRGNGLIINSQKNFLKFNLKMKGNGELIISLKSNDHRLNGKRIPIYITYTRFSINDENIVSNPIMTDHDHPFTYKLNVEDNQEIEIYLEWLPY